MKRTDYLLFGFFILATAAFTGLTAFNFLQTDVGAVEAEQNSENFSMPAGSPAIYGEELEVKYQDVSKDSENLTNETIQKMASHENINLSQEQEERYTEILYKMENGISCEYCCEAESIITENGETACSCSHAVAMRGLTKYLIEDHGEEMKDEEILREVSKWKTRYFPRQTRNKADILQEKPDTEVSYINLASNNYRGIASEDGGWVGKC